MFLCRVKLLLLLVGLTMVLSLYNNCGPVHTSDKFYSASCSLSSSGSNGQEQFLAVKKILRQNCVYCHSPGREAAFMRLDLETQEEFVREGLIVPGDPNKSKLIRQLKNYPDSSTGARSMPPEGKITDAEYSAITGWVGQLAGSCGGSNPFLCEPSTEEPEPLEAKRLSKLEYMNSLLSLFSRALGTSAAQTLLDYAQLDDLPNDNGNRYTSGDALFSSLHGQAFFTKAHIISSQLIANNNYYTQFLQTYVGYAPANCVNLNPNNLSQACMISFVDNFMYRVFGRPLLPDNNFAERASYLADITDASTHVEGVGSLVFRALMAPQFLFHIYNDLAPDTNGSSHLRLSSHSIARRLSFTLGRTIPSEELLALASNNDLFENSHFRTAVTLVSGKMDSAIQEFTKEWLKLNNLPVYNLQEHDKFALVTQGFSADEGLRQAIKEDVQDFVQYINMNDLGFRDLMTSNVSVTSNPELMNIYNQTEPAPSLSTPANAVRFPANERSGLLTRAAMLFSGTHTENPVLRGVRIRRDLFCLEIDDPPANIADEVIAPELNDIQTTRERFTETTSRGACLACHSLINPVGFALSQYNAFGAYQPSEPVFNEEGEFQQNLPTDSEVNLSISLGIDYHTSNAIEFSSRVAESTDLKKCFTRNYFAYSHNHSDLPDEPNSCSMNQMYESLNSGRSLKNFFESSTLAPSFRYRDLIIEQ